MNDAKACFDFVHNIKEGDFVFVKRGNSALLGYGIVTGPAIYDETRIDFKNFRNVEWKLKGEWNPEGRKVKGVVHWVSATQGIAAEVRVYDRLFTEAAPDADDDFLANLNPDSLTVLQAVIEPALAQAQPEDRFQFEREGYFVADQYDHTSDKPVFNRILDLKDSFKPGK